MLGNHPVVTNVMTLRVSPATTTGILHEELHAYLCSSRGGYLPASHHGGLVKSCGICGEKSGIGAGFL
jgi:hypothetical protein